MRLSKSQTRLLIDTGGSVSLLFAMIALLLFSFVGAAVDYSRWNNARSRTSDALDAALLTAGRNLQIARTREEAIAAAEAVFIQNAKTRLNLVAPKVSVQISPDGTALEGVATGKMKTPFMGLLRQGALDVQATSRVGFGFGSSSGGSDLEISMMLDVTGSMCDDGSGPCTSGAKITGLKSAASDLVNIIMAGNSTSSPNVRVALVPFSTRVRLGATRSASAEALIKKTTNLNPVWSGYYRNCDSSSEASGSTSEDAGTWVCNSYSTIQVSNWPVIPCVSDRTGADEATDAAPGPETWVNANDGGRAVLSWDSSDTPLADRVGLTAADPAEHWNHSPDGICYDINEPNTLMPLSGDKDALLQRINDLEGFGSTAGALGTAWAWYTLSPSWASVWPSESTPGSYADTLPAGSNPPKLRKIAVLMSDGLYNTYRTWRFDPANADHADEIQQIGDLTKSMCTNMKNSGIEIYTVGFDLDSLPPSDKARAKDVLEHCGTDIHHFYDALDTAQLKQSFRDIAMQLSQLYIAR